MKAEPKYDTVRDTWHPHLCPFGDECTACDARDYCEKGRQEAATAAALEGDEPGHGYWEAGDY